MNKNIFKLTGVVMVIMNLVLAACTPSAAAAQQATVAASVAKPATPAAAIAQTAGTAEANAQSYIATQAIPLPATLAAAGAQPATPAAALVQSAATMEASVQNAISGAANTLPTTFAAATPQPNAASVQTIPVFSGLQPLAANDPKAAFWLNMANGMAQKTGFQFDGKAYVTTAKAADITAFYNGALKGWKATPPAMTSYPMIGDLTVWSYSQTSQQESFTITYGAYDAAADQYLVITELLWK